MNTKLKIIVPILIVGLLVLTNPSPADHRDSFKELATEIIQETMKEVQESSEYSDVDLGMNALVSGFGVMIVNAMADNLIYRNNYLIFSTTVVKYEGESKVIGIGILGNVFLPEEKIKESIDEAREEF